MSPSRIKDLEGVRIVVMSDKSAVRAILAIQRQTFKIVCFSDAVSGRLQINPDAAAGGKQDPRKQCRRVILVYKS
jgi:hypothetical protein